MTLIDQLTDAGTNMQLYTIIGFAIISYALYKFVLRQPTPTVTTNTQQQQRTAVANNNARSNNIQTNSRTSTSSSTKSNNTNNDDEDDYTFGKSRHPRHMLPPKPNALPGSSNKAIDLSGCLLNGIIPFRSTFASGYETKLQQQQLQSQTDNDVIVNNRRERARIFARMFSSPTTAKAGTKTPSSNKPPNRGANIVITVHHSDITTTINDECCYCYCTKLQKVLYLLGTYYNLFVLVHLDDDEEEEKKKLGGNIANGGEGVNYHTKKLRTTLLNNNNQQQQQGEEGGYILNEQIIPPHRIIVTSTTKSRVAFVRQLNGTELVMDYEEQEVTKELERFGFRVLCYPREKEGDGSALGKFLIP